MSKIYTESSTVSLFGQDLNIVYKINDEEHELKLCEYCSKFLPYSEYMYNVTYCFHCWAGNFYEPLSNDLYGDFPKEMIETQVIKHYKTHLENNHLCNLENCLFKNISSLCNNNKIINDLVKQNKVKVKVKITSNSEIDVENIVYDIQI